MTDKKLIEKEIEEKIQTLLKSENINHKEKKILYAFVSNKKDPVLKKIQDLKNSLRDLQVDHGLDSGLSQEVLDFYAYLQRKFPTTGPASIFNGLIK
jgi:hypothetical protein